MRTDVHEVFGFHCGAFGYQADPSMGVLSYNWGIHLGSIDTHSCAHTGSVICVGCVYFLAK